MFNTDVGTSLIKDLHYQLQDKTNTRKLSKASEQDLTQFFEQAHEDLAKAIANYNLLPSRELTPLLKDVEKAGISLLKTVENEQGRKNPTVNAAFSRFQNFLTSAHQFSEHVQELQASTKKQAPEALRKILFADLAAMHASNPSSTKKIMKALAIEKKDVLKDIWREVKRSDTQSKLTESIDALSNIKTAQKDQQPELIEKWVQNFEKFILKSQLDTDYKRQILLHHHMQKAQTLLHTYSADKDRNISTAIAKARQEFHHIQAILEHYPDLPKTLKDLESIDKDKKSQIKEFFQAANNLIQSNPSFAYKLLKKIAKENQHEFLASISDDPKKIDLDSAKVDADLLSSIGGLHPHLENLIFGSASGNSLNLENCSPLVISGILSHMGPHIEEVIIPASFFGTKECVELVDIKQKGQQFGKGVVALQIIPDKGSESPIPVKGMELYNMISLLPTVKDLRLPPMALADDPIVLNLEYDFRYSFGIKTGRSETNEILQYYAVGIQSALNNSDERVRHAVVRSLAQGAVGDKSWTIVWIRHWAPEIPFDRLMPLWILNKPVQAETKNWERPFGSSFFSGGPEMSHLLLASDKLHRLPIDPAFGGVDFYLNPLLKDDNLDAFLKEKGTEGIPNNEKIRSLKLSWCENITDKGVHKLLEECPNLSRLELRGCSQITDRAFLNLRKGSLDGLLQLDLRGTYVSRALVEDIQEKYPKLNIFFDETAPGKEALEASRNKSGDLTLYADEKIHRHLLTMLPPGYTRAIEALQSQQSLSKSALQAFIHYLYTGNLGNIDADTALGLIQFAESPEVKCSEFSEICQLWFARTTTPQNALERWQAAKDAGIPALENYIRRFIDISCHQDSPDADQRIGKKAQNRRQKIQRQREPWNVHERFEISERAFQHPSPVWNASLAKREGRQESDITLEIGMKGIEPSLKVPANKTVLYLNSNFFRTHLKAAMSKNDKQTIKIESAHPEAAKEIVNALMAGRPVDFKDKTLRQLLHILDEADKMNIGETIIDDEKLCSWIKQLLIQSEKGSTIDDPGWVELLNWAGEHNNARIGIRLALYLRDACFNEDSTLKAEYRDNPFNALFVESFSTSAAYEKFISYAEKNSGTYGLNALLRLRTDPFEWTSKWK